MNNPKVEPEKLPREVFKTLESIVGPDYITEDRAVVEGYSRGLVIPGEILPKHMKEKTVLPAAIILPETTEEVQAIIRVASRNGIPVVPYTNGQLGSLGTIPGTLCIHMARMDKIININEENMTATLQPYVSYHQLQAETMKKGLWNGGCPLATGITKLASQFVGAGIWQTDLKYGTLSRNVISIKMILSDGDIMVTGSAGQSGAEDFWEFSPGPDIIGLARSSLGTMGILTEITVKLHTWVGGHSFPEDIGHPSIDTYYQDVENKSFDRPPLPEKHKIYWLEFPDYDNELEALYRISQSGIGIGLNAAGVYSDYYCSQTHEMTIGRAEKGFFPPWNCYVMLAGISSNKQLEYEEKVLRQIAEETKAKFLSKDYQPELLDSLAPWNQDCFRHVTGMRMCRGGWAGLIIPMGRISMVKKFSEIWARALEVVGESHMTDRGGIDSTPFIYVVNRGHFQYCETDTYPQTHSDPEGLKNSMALMVYNWWACIKEKCSPGSIVGMMMEPFHSFSPEIGPNSNILFRKVRKVFDPQGIYSPGKMVFTEEELKAVPDMIKDSLLELRKVAGL